MKGNKVLFVVFITLLLMSLGCQSEKEEAKLLFKDENEKILAT